MNQKWYKNAWRRNVVDTHIEDWNPEFMSQFDPVEYVKRLRDAEVDSAVVYAQSHTGHCNYPTKVGHMHGGLKGRDVFGQVVEECHKHGIKVVAYYSLIYSNWLYDQNPDWRMINIDGKEAAFDNRYGVCCPNSPYRDYIEKEVKEICKNYEFEGLRYDMCFWPLVCYCKHCQKRFKTEAGQELPRKINWDDPIWVKFQRCRERWLIEFAELATNIVKKYKPEASIEHQSSTYPLAWQWGVTTGLSKQCTFLQGDYYGGLQEQTFVCKLLHNLTPDTPAGYETSVAGALSVHASYKSEHLLRAQLCLALANGAAFIFIDGIDPVGTLNPDIYKKMGKILDETKVYDKYRGGQLCQDIAIYFSTESKFYLPEDNGTNAASVFNDPNSHTSTGDSMKSVHHLLPHTENMINIIDTLITKNVPFGVITKENLKALSKYKVVILSNVKMMSQEEVTAFEEYVKNGGCIYASKFTSLYHTEGTPKSDFQLKDILGVSYKSCTVENITYIAPSKNSKILPEYSKKYPISINGNQTLVTPLAGAEILGTTTLPYTNPKDPSTYASIHCNPPGIPTDNPAIVLNQYGKGKSVYVTTELENQGLHREAFWNLVQQLLSQPLLIESDAPKPVEITTFLQEDKKRYVINMCNFQKDLPSIPVTNTTICMNLKNKKVISVKNLPGEKSIDFSVGGDTIKFVVPVVKTFAMYAVYYEEQ